MLDKDKLILGIYVNIDRINTSDVDEYLTEFASTVKFDDSVMRFIIPVRGEESRVECINPVLLTEEQYKETEEKVKKLQEKVDEALGKFENE